MLHYKKTIRDQIRHKGYDDKLRQNTVRDQERYIESYSRINMISARLELATACVLDRRDNQLHQETRCGCLS